MDNYLINEKIIEEIRSYIKIKTGKLYFKHIRQMVDNIQITCPFHKDGQENKPSASIRITDNDKSYVGLFSCFTCHESMSLNEVIKRLLGDLYDEDEVNRKFNLNVIQAKQQLIEKPNRVLFKIKSNSFVSRKDIQNFKFYHPYLKQRRINEETADKYDLGFDSYNQQIIFPIYDINHNCLMLGRRSILQKVYRYPKDTTKPLYGVYELDRFIRYLWIRRRSF